MTQAACQSIVRSSMHPYPGNCVAIGHVVVFYARAAHAFSAGIKYWHCIIQSEVLSQLQVVLGQATPLVVKSV